MQQDGKYAIGVFRNYERFLVTSQSLSRSAVTNMKLEMS